MSMSVRGLLAGLLVLCGLGAAGNAQAEVVISQVYGAGGNSGAVFDRDYVELFNRGGAPVLLAGRSVQYASATGSGNFGANANQIVVLPAATLQPGHYYLVALAGGSNGAPLPDPDASGTINMSASSGKVALVDSTGGLGCNGGSTPCNAAQEALILDLVGFGSANYYEGSGPAPGLSASLAGFRADGGCTDTGDNGADFGTGTPAPRNSASIPNVCGGGGDTHVSIGDTSALEGDSGLTPFFFTISLNQPAGDAGVSVDFATADGTAVAGEDYVAKAGTASFAAGQTSLTVTIDVIGDEVPEPDETFHVDLDNAVGALIANGRGTGTILNDDVTTLPIHAIQGPGQYSPYDGQQVATSGIVTARKNNGFFLQTPDGEDDGNPATSEGIFVFTASAPPDEALVGHRVLVQGTVAEFIPPADPHQLPLTEIVDATVATVSTGHPLPAPTVITADMLDPEGGLDQLEHLEGMRVTAPAFTVVAPTGGNINETQATATSHGRFAVVPSGMQRPMREPGIRIPDPDPLGSTAPDIPRWDFAPELVAVNSLAIGAPAADVAAGCEIVDGSLTGPLDYTFRRYTIYPEGALDVDCSADGQPRPANLPGPDHASFATYNLHRFFGATPGHGGPVLAPEAFERRLAKASLGIRNYLHAPDVIGASEVGSLQALQALADRLNADAVAAGQPDPGYVAYLVPGNEVGGIDVAYLVREGEVAPGVARVQVGSVSQAGAEELLANPDGTTTVLNDRPPLVLDAVVNFADGRSLPVTTVVVHQRSLIGIDDDAGGSNGWTSAGERVRVKRQRQAEFLAGLIDDMQAQDPGRRIVVLGDFNAFEFNDGYVDVMGTVTGLPSPDGETAVDGDGAALVDPALRNTTLDVEVSERYGYSFDYVAQSLDHILVNQALVDSELVVDYQLTHARINADFPEVARNDGETPTRLSDHDPSLLLVRLGALDFADLEVMAEAIEASAIVGGALDYAVTVVNNGPDDAQFPGVGFSLDATLDDLAVSAPAGWACEEPTVSAAGTELACTANSLEAEGEAVFGLSATAPENALGSSVVLVGAATSQTADPDEANNEASASIEVVQAPVEAIELQNGVPLTGFSGAAGDAHLFRIEVPAGARHLRLTSYGGSGDVSLYASLDQPPTADDWDARSTRPGNNETVHVPAPAAGTWYIRVIGERPYTRLSVRAGFTP